MPCLCVSPPSGFSSPTLRRPHLSPPPAYRGFRKLDRESGKLWGVRAGAHHFSSERTRSRRHPLGIQDQGRRSIQGPTGRDGVVTSPRDLCPVCRLQSIRMAFTIAAEVDYEAYMLDVQTAFPNSHEEDGVFVKTPPATNAATSPEFYSS